MAALRSQLRRAVLAWFYCDQNSSAYVRQMAGILQVDSTNLSRELARRGFIRPHLQQNQLHYKIYRRHKDTPAILDNLCEPITHSPDWQRLFPTQNPKHSINRRRKSTHFNPADGSMGPPA